MYTRDNFTDGQTRYVKEKAIRIIKPLIIGQENCFAQL